MPRYESLHEKIRKVDGGFNRVKRFIRSTISFRGWYYRRETLSGFDLLTIMLYILGLIMYSAYYFGWYFWLFLIFLIILHCSGGVIRIGERWEIHIAVIVVVAVMVFNAVTGWGFDGHLNFRHYYPLWCILSNPIYFGRSIIAGTIIFVIDYLTTTIDIRRGGVISYLILPLSFFKGSIALSVVSINYLPLFVFVPFFLVDIIKGRKMDELLLREGLEPGGVYGGAGLFDGLIVEPFLIGGMMFLSRVMFGGLHDLYSIYYYHDPQEKMIIENWLIFAGWK